MIGDRCHLYTADVLSTPSENVPALMDIPDMAAMGALIDCRSGNFILPGPGGLEIKASPGTTEVKMQRDTHWLLGVGSPNRAERATSCPPKITRSENRLLNSWQVESTF